MNRSQSWKKGRKNLSSGLKDPSRFTLLFSTGGEQCKQAEGTTLGSTWVWIWATVNMFAKGEVFKGLWKRELAIPVAQKFLLSL